MVDHAAYVHHINPNNSICSCVPANAAAAACMAPVYLCHAAQLFASSQRCLQCMCPSLRATAAQSCIFAYCTHATPRSSPRTARYAAQLAFAAACAGRPAGRWRAGIVQCSGCRRKRGSVCRRIGACTRSICPGTTALPPHQHRPALIANWGNTAQLLERASLCCGLHNRPLQNAPGLEQCISRLCSCTLAGLPEERHSLSHNVPQLLCDPGGCWWHLDAVRGSGGECGGAAGQQQPRPKLAGWHAPRGARCPAVARLGHGDVALILWQR